MDDYVLLHYAPIIASPCQESDIIAAELAEALHSVRKREAVGKTLFVKAGYFFHLIMHAPEIYGLYIYCKLFGRAHILIKLDGADLDYLTAKVYRQLIEDGGFGTHSLIPFQVHHNVIHNNYSFINDCFFIITYLSFSCICFFEFSK